MTQTTDDVRGDLARLQQQVYDLRLSLLRGACLVALALMVMGTVIPAFHDRHDNHPNTYRVATAGVQAFQQSDEGDSFAVFAGIGFLGLLVVVVLLALVLVSSVMLGEGKSKNRWARTALITLSLIGVAVAMIFSVAPNDSAPGSSGGWGPLVLAVGLVLTAWILLARSWQDLWLDRRGDRR